MCQTNLLDEGGKSGLVVGLSVTISARTEAHPEVPGLVELQLGVAALH